MKIEPGSNVAIITRRNGKPCFEGVAEVASLTERDGDLLARVTFAADRDIAPVERYIDPFAQNETMFSLDGYIGKVDGIPRAKRLATLNAAKSKDDADAVKNGMFKLIGEGRSYAARIERLAMNFDGLNDDVGIMDGVKEAFDAFGKIESALIQAEVTV